MKKRRRMSPEERATWEARSEKITRKLHERIAYHEARLREEQEKRSGEGRS